ncbi:MAG: bifunctional folylpolyglutamate synthase/dihydrofolate synthase [Verrucomicrobia bacterium]|nr:bifunctional folylpolyglutamate synthase/dihydrofolate synthase [Verrucomicrobiota bacterium]
MNYSEAIQFLYGLRWFGANLGLENTFKLAALAGNPQERLRFIHVAGTNGKGSTCAMLESIYRAARLRVGLFTSPHLVAFGERIQVDRRVISEPDVVRLVEEIQPWLKTFPTSAHPTFFEVVTVMALRYFAEQNVDLVIWETGLGGRLDATNIVTPLASVITNIQLDHEKWLGHTLAKIAAEKAGIIKAGIPVLTAADHPEALRVISETAARNQSILTEVKRADAEKPPLNKLRLPLLGEHQRLNAALALATVRVLEDKIPVGEEAMRKGLASVSWPGRLQIVRSRTDRTIVLDGAHNPAGVRALRAAIEELFPETLLTLVFGVMEDKNWQAMCELLAPLANRILLAPVSSDRSASPRAMSEFCQRLNVQAEIVVCASLAEALSQADSDPLVLVTGSLHFVGEATEALRLSACPAHNERGLNEWTLQTS